MILLVIVLVTMSLCASILLIGHYATVRVRLEHEEKMIRLGEEMKMNALTIRERDIAIAERGMRVLGLREV